MPVTLYLSFVAYALAATVLPGPNNVLLLSVAGRAGFRKCIPLIAGIWSGLITVMAIAGIFLSTLDRFIPRITPIVKYIGAAYILYLAWKTLIRKPVGEENDDRDAGTPVFRDGFLLQFLNIKVMMLGLAAFPGYFLTDGVTWPRIVLIPLFAVSMTACCGTGNLIWALAGSLLKPLYNRFCRPVNLCMALLLVWCAIKILMTGR